VSPSLAEQLATDLASDKQNFHHEALSGREMEVLRLMASGKAITQIADTLSLSGKTVSTYRSRILEKMNVTHLRQFNAVFGTRALGNSLRINARSYLHPCKGCDS